MVGPPVLAGADGVAGAVEGAVVGDSVEVPDGDAELEGEEEPLGEEDVELLAELLVELVGVAVGEGTLWSVPPSVPTGRPNQVPCAGS